MSHVKNPSPAASSALQENHHDDASPYSVGDIIWLKVPGCPYWPSKILNSNDKSIPSTVLQARESSHHILVEFFNAEEGEEYYWIDLSKENNHKLFSSDPYMLDSNPSALKHPLLKKAIKMAKEQCGIAVVTSQKKSSKKRKDDASDEKRKDDVSDKKRKDDASDEKRKDNASDKKRKDDASDENVEEEKSNEMMTQPQKKTKHSPVDKVVLTDDELSNIQIELDQAISNQDLNSIKEYIKFIHDKCTDITVEQLKKVKIGKSVASLRKSEDQQVASMAKELVKQWTNKVNVESNTSSNITVPSTTVSQKKSQSATSSTTTNSMSSTSALTKSAKKPNTSNITTNTMNTSATTTNTTMKTNPTTTTTNTNTNTNTTTNTPSNKPVKSLITTTTPQKPPVKPLSKSTSMSSNLSSNSSNLSSNSSSNLSSNSHSIKSPPTTPVPTMDLSSIPQVADESRNRWRTKIAQGLSLVKDATESKVIELCVEIENAVFNYFKSNPQIHNHTYDDQCRTLGRNLCDSKNEDFRSNVYHGVIVMDALPTMKVQEMASKEKQKERQILQERKQHQDMVAKPAEVESSMFRCGKCKQTKCTYFEMQTRSADEPMTAFITCLNCGNKWKQ
ncbi:hypothetical protein C9374_000563 [Naegleria lovaniensis]|uniref:Uncharacterized protein n=1 Tax=Naegleria lovaniensis TaxID=51637 RepID=A0AA88GZ90_NAELO|nr:uncharacterized protein C9374_000563 [Naegleria lovaniensis]KAG2388399.1 hypothetical protein C9374_000563 [Naegleria lovaniensis]